MQWLNTVTTASDTRYVENLPKNRKISYNPLLEWLIPYSKGYV